MAPVSLIEGARGCAMEGAVVPLAYELASVHQFPIVSACEGHAPSAAPERPARTDHIATPWPEVRFSSSSLAHVALLSRVLSEKQRSLELETSWGVIVEPAVQRAPTTFAVRPLRSAEALPLSRLQQDARRLAVELANELREQARSALAGAAPPLLESGPSGVRVDAQAAHGVAGLDELTPRELEVLGHFLQGFSVRSISEELFISAYTARNHLKSIFHKLGLSSQRELRELFATRVIFYRQ